MPFEKRKREPVKKQQPPGPRGDPEKFADRGMDLVTVYDASGRKVRKGTKDK